MKRVISAVLGLSVAATMAVEAAEAEADRIRLHGCA